MRPGDTAVPTADSADNVTTRDVIGSKSDGHDGNSIYSIVDILRDHTHSAQMVHPTLANAITVTAGAVGWTLGGAATVVAGSAIGTDFDIHYVVVSAISANENYELHLYDDGAEVCRIAFSRSNNFSSELPVPCQTPIIAADSVITAKLATVGGGEETCTVKIVYHVY